MSADAAANDRLERYRRNITSQNGEDGIIEYLLGLAPAIPKTCLEVGAHDGVSMSNTWHLWADLGWKALLIESSQGLFEELKASTAAHDGVTAVRAMIAPQGAQSLENIAREAAFSLHIGVMSLDIDANELEIFEHLNGMVADIVVLEFNHEIPVDISYRDLPGDIFFRHSAKAIEAVATAHGYRIVTCVGANAVLVREAAFGAEALARLPREPVEALFDHDFVRKRLRGRHFVRSKFITEELAVRHKPGAVTALLARLYSNGRKLRRCLRGIKPGARITEARRQNLKRAGLWI